MIDFLSKDGALGALPEPAISPLPSALGTIMKSALFALGGVPEAGDKSEGEGLGWG